MQTLQTRPRVPEVKGLQKAEKEASKRSLARARPRPPSLETHQHARPRAQTFSLPIRAPVSWLQGLWDSPARWQPFLSQAGKTGSGFLCLCASDSYRERASERVHSLFFIYLLLFFIFFSFQASRPHARTPARAHLHRRATRKAREADLQTGSDAERDELMGNA